MGKPSTIFLILVVIACICSAGCTQSSDTCPVTTPAPQIVQGTVPANPSPAPTPALSMATPTAIPMVTENGYEGLVKKNTIPVHTVSVEDLNRLPVYLYPRWWFS